MLGVIGGTVFLKGKMLKAEMEERIDTKHGPATVQKAGGIAFIPRHGFPAKIPPHKINHRANIAALGQLGAKKIIGVNSAGSLKKEIKPGSIAIPGDYINFFNVQTFFDTEIRHTAPGLSETLRKEMLEIAKELGIPVLGHGTYFQAHGPRFETRAESGFIAGFADFVGMTMASEATLAKEQGIEYAAICSIDNYANGISKETPSHERIVEGAAKNAERIWKIIEKTADLK